MKYFTPTNFVQSILKTILKKYLPFTIINFNKNCKLRKKRSYRKEIKTETRNTQLIIGQKLFKKNTLSRNKKHNKFSEPYVITEFVQHNKVKIKNRINKKILKIINLLKFN